MKKEWHGEEIERQTDEIERQIDEIERQTEEIERKTEETGRQTYRKIENRKTDREKTLLASAFGNVAQSKEMPRSPKQCVKT